MAELVTTTRTGYILTTDTAVDKFLPNCGDDGTIGAHVVVDSVALTNQTSAGSDPPVFTLEVLTKTGAVGALITIKASDKEAAGSVNMNHLGAPVECPYGAKYELTKPTSTDPTLTMTYYVVSRRRTIAPQGVYSAN